MTPRVRYLKRKLAGIARRLDANDGPARMVQWYDAFGDWYECYQKLLGAALADGMALRCECGQTHLKFAVRGAPVEPTCHDCGRLLGGTI